MNDPLRRSILFESQGQETSTQKISFLSTYSSRSGSSTRIQSRRLRVGGFYPLPNFSFFDVLNNCEYLTCNGCLLRTQQNPQQKMRTQFQTSNIVLSSSETAPYFLHFVDFIQLQTHLYFSIVEVVSSAYQLQVMSCLLGCLACFFCDFLCCECNCIIFPHPDCSYEEEASLDELDISMRISFHKNEEREMPFVEMSTPKSRASKKCIVYFHGNAEDIGLVVTFLQPIVLATNITFFALEYPTYGLYSKPFSANISDTIKEDALAFYDSLLKEREHDDIAVMGRSIGSGGASFLAGNRNVPALILVSPFDTIKKVSRGMVGCLGGIVKQHFNNEQQLKKFNGRLLVIHGQQDEVIRISHGKNLVNVYESQNPYKNTTVTNYPTRMTHNKFDLAQDIVRPVVAFLKETGFKSAEK